MLLSDVSRISFPSGSTHGDSVTQMEGQVTMSEGALLTINCTYSATTSAYPTLFWYVQYPGKGLQLLLKAVKANDKVSNKGFEATYNKGATSFLLEKASVQESDSAPSSGEMVFLICQNSYSQQNATEGRYSVNFQKASKSIQLVISASQLGDSGVYFCALREGTVRGLLEGGAQKPRVCLRQPPAGGTKAGSGHLRREVGRAVSAHVWGGRENTHSEEPLSRFIDHIRVLTNQTSPSPESLD
uniref:Ig-like domain-containing protein n=1 Tax=Marmota marmota marmota TaxID=9994 RepID=A0A8C5ZJK8_MARMA